MRLRILGFHPPRILSAAQVQGFLSVDENCAKAYAIGEHPFAGAGGHFERKRFDHRADAGHGAEVQRSRVPLLPSPPTSAPIGALLGAVARTTRAARTARASAGIRRRPGVTSSMPFATRVRSRATLRLCTALEKSGNSRSSLRAGWDFTSLRSHAEGTRKNWRSGDGPPLEVRADGIDDAGHFVTGTRG